MNLDVCVCNPIQATEDSSVQQSETATVQVDLVANKALGDTLRSRLPLPGRTYDLVYFGNQRKLHPSYRDSSFKILPLVTFLILFISFIVLGSCIAVVAVRLLRAKRSRKEVIDSSISSRQSNELQVERNKCPICQSYECQGHTDGVTSFRATLSYATELSDPDLNITERCHHKNSFAHSTAQTNQDDGKTPGPPLPFARRDIRKSVNTESTSTGVVSTSTSTNSTTSSNSSTAERSSAESNHTNLKAGKLPLTFVPTAITASNGHYRGGETVEPASHIPHHTHQIANYLGAPLKQEAKISNSVDPSCATSTAKKTEQKEKEKKTMEGDYVENKTQERNEDRTVKERLKNKLNKILPQFLRDENPRVRFDDRNIWAFEEETRSVIY